MSRFFIDRPIFAWVIALGMILAGILSIRSLPVSQFPPLAPPQPSWKQELKHDSPAPSESGASPEPPPEKPE